MNYQDGDDDESYKTLEGEPKREGPFGNPRIICEVETITDLGKAGCDDVDKVYLVHDKHHWSTIVNMGMDLRVP
jgi:hypothetical protein